jgi:hypothetical protein
VREYAENIGLPLEDLAGELTSCGIPDPLLTLGKSGTVHQLYIPSMQAGQTRPFACCSNGPVQTWLRPSASYFIAAFGSSIA